MLHSWEIYKNHGLELITYNGLIQTKCKQLKILPSSTLFDFCECNVTTVEGFKCTDSLKDNGVLKIAGTNLPASMKVQFAIPMKVTKIQYQNLVGNDQTQIKDFVIQFPLASNYTKSFSKNSGSSILTDFLIPFATSSILTPYLVFDFLNTWSMPSLQPNSPSLKLIIWVEVCEGNGPKSFEQVENQKLIQLQYQYTDVEKDWIHYNALKVEVSPDRTFFVGALQPYKKVQTIAKFLLGNIIDRHYWKYELPQNMTIQDMQISRDAKTLYLITKNPSKLMLLHIGENCTLKDQFNLPTEQDAFKLRSDQKTAVICGQNQLKEMDLKFSKKFSFNYDFDTPNVPYYICNTNSLAISRDDLYIAIPSANLQQVYIFKQNMKNQIALLEIGSGIQYMQFSAFNKYLVWLDSRGFIGICKVGSWDILLTQLISSQAKSFLLDDDEQTILVLSKDDYFYWVTYNEVLKVFVVVSNQIYEGAGLYDMKYLKSQYTNCRVLDRVNMKCKICSDQFTNKDGKCQLCPDKVQFRGVCCQNYEFLSSDGIACQKCDPMCDKCRGSTVFDCIACRQGTFLTKFNICQQICPLGTYASIYQQKCIDGSKVPELYENEICTQLQIIKNG